MLLRHNPNVIYTFDYFVPDEWCFGSENIPKYPGVYNCSQLVGGGPWTDIACTGPAGGAQPTAFDAAWNAQNFATFVAPMAEKVPALSWFSFPTCLLLTFYNTYLPTYLHTYIHHTH